MRVSIRFGDSSRSLVFTRNEQTVASEPCRSLPGNRPFGWLTTFDRDLFLN
jgi:hypothetical protein